MRYDVVWNENGTVGEFNYYLLGIDKTGNNKIYAPVISNSPIGMWLVSPSSLDDKVSMYVRENGRIGNDNVGSQIGICPVVCLKPGVQIEASGDGFRIK